MSALEALCDCALYKSTFTFTLHYYIEYMQKLARRLPGIDEWMLRCIVVRGLRPQMKAFVLQQQPTSMGQILDAARFTETTGIAGAGAGGG